MLRKVIAPKGRIPRTANLAQLTYLAMALVNGDDVNGDDCVIGNDGIGEWHWYMVMSSMAMIVSL